MNELGDVHGVGEGGGGCVPSAESVGCSLRAGAVAFQGGGGGCVPSAIVRLDVRPPDDGLATVVIKENRTKDTTRHNDFC